jgi:nucleoside-diphosphate-sugar epimerase/CBS domain-containing protein
MTHALALIERHTSIKEALRIIERTPFDAALVVNEQGVYLGGVLTADLRRLLISGVKADDEIGAYPVKYTYSLSEVTRRSPQAVEAVLKDVRLHGVNYLPIVSPSGEVQDVLSLRDLEQAKTDGTPATVAEREKKILVVGGAGYLGSILTRLLLQRGYRVRVLDSFIYGRRSLDDLAGNDRLEVLEGDLRNIRTCVSSLEGINAVVLLAAIVGDPASKARPTETIETNVLAAQALAHAAKLQQISRFVYASTCSVYGVGADLLDEDAALNPVSLYARSKIASEEIIRRMGDEYFAPTILRMGTLYGYSPRMRFDLVVNTMTMKSFTDRKISVFGGKQWRPLLHVADAAEVYLRCIESDLKDVGNQIFNVGSDLQNYQIDQIAELVSTSLGGIPIARDNSTLDARDYRVSFAKVQDTLAFTPASGIDDAAKRIYTALEDGTIKNPAQRIYYNHYFDATEE